MKKLKLVSTIGLLLLSAFSSASFASQEALGDAQPQSAPVEKYSLKVVNEGDVFKVSSCDGRTDKCSDFVIPSDGGVISIKSNFKYVEYYEDGGEFMYPVYADYNYGTTVTVDDGLVSVEHKDVRAVRPTQENDFSPPIDLIDSVEVKFSNRVIEGTYIVR